MAASTKRVLMVDPDFEAVAFVRQAFHGWDEPVEFDNVDNAELAWDYLHGGESNLSGMKPNLLITELELAGESGLEMIMHLKGDPELSKLPVAVYTASQDADLISKAYKLKVSCSIPKPADPDRVPNLVKDLRHFFLRDEAAGKGNPLLEALNNPAKRKKASKAFAEVAEAQIQELIEKTEETEDERREHKRAGSSLAVHLRVFSAVEVGRVIKVLSQPNPDLKKLAAVDESNSMVSLACFDISEGGVGTEGHPDLLAGKSFSPGNHVAMAIDMPEGPSPIRAIGQVMWETQIRSNLHKGGLMFLAISNEDRERIQKYVKLRV